MTAETWREAQCQQRGRQLLWATQWGPAGHQRLPQPRPDPAAQPPCTRPADRHNQASFR